MQKAQEALSAEEAAINEAIDSNKNVFEIADGIVVSEETKVDNVVPAEEPQAPEYGDSTLVITPEDKLEETSTEEEEIPQDKVEDNQEISNESLEDLFDSTEETTEFEEIVEEQPAEIPEENNTIEEEPVEEEITQEPVEETPVQSEVEEPKEEVKEEQPVITPVSVSAVDGYETVVGSNIQFVIDGTDVQINGLDGIDYSFNGGILSINVGAEATTLTVEVCNSVSSQVFNILVNGIVG